MPPSGTGEYNGLVRSTVGGAYEVEVFGGGNDTAGAGLATESEPGSESGHGAEPRPGSVVIEASLRGRLKREQRTGDAVVVGDRVRAVEQPEGGWTIEAVAERSSELARRAPGGGRRAKVLVANVDQLVVVFSAARPDPNPRLLDRFLVLAEASGVDALVVANKVDLDGSAGRVFGVYEEIGYPVLYTSAEDGRGAAALRDRLCGRVSALAGPSGVGKSSLLNRVQPGLELRTAEVSDAVNKGRHTTVSARLIPLECGGYVADTPGLRELGLWDVPKEELDLHYVEMIPYLDGCRFGGSCTHTHEPGCAVLAAVEAGEVRRARYESYRALVEADGEERTRR